MHFGHFFSQQQRFGGLKLLTFVNEFQSKYFGNDIICVNYENSDVAWHDNTVVFTDPGESVFSTMLLLCKWTFILMYADVLGLSVRIQALSFSQVSSAPITRLSVSLFVSDRWLSDTSSGERAERRGRRALSPQRMNGGLLCRCRMLPDANQILQFVSRCSSRAARYLAELWKLMNAALSWCPQLMNVQNAFSFYLQSSACVHS